VALANALQQGRQTARQSIWVVFCQIC